MKRRTMETEKVRNQTDITESQLCGRHCANQQTVPASEDFNKKSQNNLWNRVSLQLPRLHFILLLSYCLFRTHSLFHTVIRTQDGRDYLNKWSIKSKVPTYLRVWTRFQKDVEGPDGDLYKEANFFCDKDGFLSIIQHFFLSLHIINASVKVTIFQYLPSISEKILAEGLPGQCFPHYIR